MYISDKATLDAFCERAKRAKVIAVDTEFIRERTYHPKLCLVQVATADETAAIDPLLIEDLSSLRDLFVDEGITKVFHACAQDLEVIRDALGCVPSPIFDTQIAAAFLGRRHQIGYGALVESFCGVRLPKAAALTDWSLRPLDEEQIRYAEDDVAYLPGIYDQMVTELVKLDRLSWLGPEMDAMTESVRTVRDPREAFRRLKRSSSLTRRQMAVAREVCAWREMVAERKNIPRKWVVSDEVLVETCKALPRNVNALKRIRGTEQLSNRAATELVEAIARGVRCDATDLPTIVRRDHPSVEMQGVLDLMYALLRIISDKSGIATQLIGSREDLYDLMVNRKDARLATGWRNEVAGKELNKLINGEVGLTVKDGHIQLL